MNVAFLSIGSNIGDRTGNIKKAISFIKERSSSISVSPLYITKPMYYINQPYFINCAVKISTWLSAEELLSFISDIEKKLRRKRLFPNSPRTIDIDIIYFNHNIINLKNLKIPHPRVYERAFVLKPVCDIDKCFTDPVKKENVGELLEKIKINLNDIIKLPSTYGELIDFISIIPPRRSNDFKTSYIKDTLSAIGNPQKKCGKIIHITGSCGKTTTAFYISELLRKKGYRTSIYTSPHIIDIRERIISDGKIISKRDFYNIFLRIISSSVHLHSVFEYLTLVAIVYFSEKSPDYSVIEVGMGGRDDATNVFEKSTSVFTTITKEHQKYLGRDIKSIAENKSGIIKKNGNVFVSSLNDDEVIKILKSVALKNKNKFYISDISNHKSKNNIFADINFLFAVSIVNNIDKKKFKLEKIKNRFPARHQLVKYKKISILLDGAHTPLSMRLLMDNNISSKYKVCLIGFMNDKKVSNMMDIIKSKSFKKVILTVPTSKRSFLPSKQYEENIIFIKDLKKAFKYALGFNENIVVTGSLYFCADILSLIKKNKNIILNELL